MGTDLPQLLCSKKRHAKLTDCIKVQGPGCCLAASKPKHALTLVYKYVCPALCHRMLKIHFHHGPRWHQREVAWVLLPRQVLQAAQNDHDRGCPVLGLPIELLLMISEQLPSASRVFFSQTCRPLRRVFAHLRPPEQHEIPSEDRLEYLVDRVRNIPDRWLCELCLELHPIHPYDTPQHPLSVTCPLERQRLRKRGYGLTTIRLDYRHVQLTLKYARMTAGASQGYNDYLRALLKPIVTSFTTRPGSPDLLHVRHSIFPRVVAGRYLLQSIYTYMQNYATVTRETVGELRVCLHQRCAPVNGRMANLFSNGQRPSWGLPQPVGTSLGETSEAAFQYMGQEMCGHCPHCLTDFSVYATPQRALVRVWQDLGPEGSPLEPAWVVHTRTFRRHLDMRVPHCPGTIRELHGEGPEAADRVAQTGVVFAWIIRR